MTDGASDYFSASKALLDRGKAIKEFNPFSFFSVGHSLCWSVGFEQAEDDSRGCFVSQGVNPRQEKKWGTQRLSSVRLSSTGMRC